VTNGISRIAYYLNERFGVTLAGGKRFGGDHSFACLSSLILVRRHRPVGFSAHLPDEVPRLKADEAIRWERQNDRAT
jgi:hypothetical protein